MSEFSTDKLMALLLAASDEQFAAVAGIVAKAKEERQTRQLAAQAEKREARIAEIEAVIGNHECPHSNIQEFTEICLGCGHNIYECTRDRYLADLEIKFAAHNAAK